MVHTMVEASGSVDSRSLKGYQLWPLNTTVQDVESDVLIRGYQKVAMKMWGYHLTSREAQNW